MSAETEIRYKGTLILSDKIPVNFIHINPHQPSNSAFRQPYFLRNMNQFSTPQPKTRSRSVSNKEFLSKTGLIDLLRLIDFDGLYLPAELASDNVDDTPDFFKEICRSLVTVLLAHAPHQVSPKKLLDSSSPILSTSASYSVDEFSSPGLKLYGSKGKLLSAVSSSHGLDALAKPPITLWSENTPDPSFPPFPEDADQRMYNYLAFKKKAT